MICTWVLKAVALPGVGEEGVAVLAAAVVMDEMVEARLVAVKLNGPPALPTVIFWTATVAGFGVLVKVHFILAAATTLAAGMVRVLPTTEPKLAGFPVTLELESEHRADVNVKAAFASVS